jgi:hypothetical protein
LTHITTEAELQVVLTQVRELLPLFVDYRIDPSNVVLSETRSAITIRGTAEQVALLERIVAGSDYPVPDVTVETTFLEVDSSDMKQLGLLPPESISFPAYPLAIDEPPLRREPPQQTTAFSIPQVLATFLTNNARITVLGTERFEVTRAALRAQSPVANGTAQLRDGSLSVDVSGLRILLNHDVGLETTVSFSMQTGSPQPDGRQTDATVRQSNRHESHESRVGEGQSMLVAGIPALRNQRERAILITPRVTWPAP